MDYLTGIYNRRGLFELGKREVERAVRFGHPLSLIIIDIDHFKDVNDTYGHAAGDQVLQLMAKLCLNNIREIDIIGRYGGEEFVILLPESSAPDACIVAERLCSLVAGEPFSTPGGDIPITISLGVSTVDENNESLEGLIKQADKSLYKAKLLGRNRVGV
jgi:diguanylate cyclase (GGDEF)-like protein